ncbi:MAG TPA: helix-turn-helix domain-containing protein [Ignavibacteria bacterium]|jgi:transcriptional regulator GlxA family with amidase domain
MKHLSIIVPEGDCSLVNIEGTHQIFSEVNSYLASKGKPSLFNIQLVGLNKEARIKKGFFTIHPDAVTDDIEKTDLIIIPAPHGDMKKSLELNRDFIPWLIKQYKSGAEIASLCIGSFLTAATGLLNGKKCSTHWIAANDFRKMFPEVNLVPDKVITDQQGIYSSGGAYSGLNLIIYLVEKYAGREAAVYCSKTFEIDIERGSQSPFIIFKGQKEHEDDPVKKAQEFIENNFRDKITIDQLAAMLFLSRRNFERRFKKATSNTVVEYIQRVKIEAAKMSLESARENVNEVMYNVGYTDPKAFRNMFRRITGLSPIEYRNKYQRQVPSF